MLLLWKHGNRSQPLLWNVWRKWKKHHRAPTRLKIVAVGSANEKTDSPGPSPQVGPDWLQRRPATCPQPGPQRSPGLKAGQVWDTLQVGGGRPLRRYHGNLWPALRTSLSHPSWSDNTEPDGSCHCSLRDALPTMHQERDNGADGSMTWAATVRRHRHRTIKVSQASIRANRRRRRKTCRSFSSKHLLMWVKSRSIIDFSNPQHMNILLRQ